MHSIHLFLGEEAATFAHYRRPVNVLSYIAGAAQVFFGQGITHTSISMKGNRGVYIPEQEIKLLLSVNQIALGTSYSKWEERLGLMVLWV